VLAERTRGAPGEAGGLAGVLAAPERLPTPVGAEVLDGVRALLDEAAREATATGGWSDDDPLRLSKGPVGWLVRCPRRALAADAGGAPSDDLVLGLLVDAGAKLVALAARRPVTVAGALGYLDAQGDEVVAAHLEALDAAGRRGLLDEADARIARLEDAWPEVPPAWWPRVEEPVRVRLAGGAVTVTGRLDALLGGPPTAHPGVVVEVKGGRWYDGMRADGHLYALLAGLRDGVAPAAVVTLVADGTSHVEPIRPALVSHAAERLELALRTAASLAAGEPAATHPGTHCAHCPARGDCDPGTLYLATHEAGPPA
jgi:hypothetical protein